MPRKTNERELAAVAKRIKAARELGVPYSRTTGYIRLQDAERVSGLTSSDPEVRSALLELLDELCPTRGQRSGLMSLREYRYCPVFARRLGRSRDMKLHVLALEVMES